VILNFNSAQQHTYDQQEHAQQQHSQQQAHLQYQQVHMSSTSSLMSSSSLMPIRKLKLMLTAKAFCTTKKKKAKLIIYTV
jgi:hypothetical protein